MSMQSQSGNETKLPFLSSIQQGLFSLLIAIIYALTSIHYAWSSSFGIDESVFTLMFFGDFPLLLVGVFGPPPPPAFAPPRPPLFATISYSLYLASNCLAKAAPYVAKSIVNILDTDCTWAMQTEFSYWGNYSCLWFTFIILMSSWNWSASWLRKI